MGTAAAAPAGLRKSSLGENIESEPRSRLGSQTWPESILGRSIFVFLPVKPNLNVRVTILEMKGY